jgi:hypothetical protein
MKSMTPNATRARLTNRRLMQPFAIAILIAFGASPVRAAEPATAELLEVFAEVGMLAVVTITKIPSGLFC